MIDKIKESDWKYLNRLKPVLLERAFARINKEAALILKKGKDGEQRPVYHAMYKHYNREDEMIAECFDDYRRSMAKARILSLVRHGIMSDEELEGFSEDTKEFVRFIIERE